MSRWEMGPPDESNRSLAIQTAAFLFCLAAIVILLYGGSPA